MMITYLVRIALAGLVGFIMGVISNRQDRTRSSRVFAIICMSSALLVTVSMGIGEKIPSFGDPSRIMAQITSAIGFLLTGIIWVTQDKQVAGINTAAALLLAAIIGMLVGAGLENASVLGTFFFVLIYWLSDFLSSYKRKKIRAGDKIPPADAG